MKKIVFAALVAVFLAGCSTTPTEAPIEDKSATTDASKAGAASGAATSGASTAGVSGMATGQSANPLKDPNNILSKRSVYFEYDSFAVADQYKPIIEAHIKYLNGNRTAKVTLQGHADERGSREYNLGLGEHRALAVRKQLVLLGASAAQIKTVSYGEERPAVDGHEESAYRMNRRVELVY